MSTVQQRAAFEKLVEIGGKSVSRAMRESKLPYSEKTAKTPKKLTESKGFQELCNEFGLTDNFLIEALVNDIREKPKNRKAELELAFKVKQRLKEDRDGDTFNTQINIFNEEQAKAIAERISRGHEQTDSNPV